MAQNKNEIQSKEGKEVTEKRITWKMYIMDDIFSKDIFIQHVFLLDNFQSFGVHRKKEVNSFLDMRKMMKVSTKVDKLIKTVRINDVKCYFSYWFGFIV